MREHRRLTAALAIAAYLVVGAFALRNVLRSPSTLLGYPSTIGHQINMVLLDRYDQSMVIATMVRNAQLLTSRPLDLLADVGQCFPMPQAYTLGGAHVWPGPAGESRLRPDPRPHPDL